MGEDSGGGGDTRASVPFPSPPQVWRQGPFRRLYFVLYETTYLRPPDWGWINIFGHLETPEG